MWLSALNVYFRDISNLLPFITQLWFFVTPIFYSVTKIPEPWRTLIYLNPMSVRHHRLSLGPVQQWAAPDLMMVLVFLATLLMALHRGNVLLSQSGTDHRRRGVKKPLAACAALSRKGEIGRCQP